jgi:4-amino-4-deoxy-L-arabinose transferase-like glycosyltransferase
MDILLKKLICLLPIDRTRLHQLLLAILLLSVMSKLALSILVMIYHPNGVFEDSDSSEYHRLALNLLQHGTFSQSPRAPYEPEVLRTPAYPLILAGFYGIVGVQPVIIVFLQIALSAATIFIGFKIATVLLHEQAGLLAALLLATDPVSIYHTQVLLTETAFTTSVSLCLLLFLHALMDPSRWHWSAGASTCLALATYIRPTSYYFGFILPLIFFIMTFPTIGWQRAAKSALVFLSLYAVLTGGWQLHNYLQTGSIEFSQMKNRYLFVAKAAEIVAMRDDLSLEDAQQRLASEHFQYALALIAQHPALFLWATFKGVLASLFGPSNLSHLFGLDSVELRQSLLKGDFSKFSYRHWTMAFSSWIYGVGFLIILYLGVLLLIVRRGFFSQGMALLLFTVLYVLVISSGPEAYSRFRLPVMPALCVMAAAGFLHTCKTTKPEQNSQRNRAQD